MASPFQIGGPNDPWLRLKSDRLLGCSLMPFHGGEPVSQRLQHATQMHDRLILANAISALGQQSGLNRSQIVSVKHLLGDRVDQHFTELEEEWQCVYLSP